MSSNILSNLERGMRVGTVLGYPLYMGAGCVYTIIDGDHIQAASCQALEQKILRMQERQRRNVGKRSILSYAIQQSA